MTDISPTLELLIYILDLFGTMAFAVTGAFKAIEHKADILGILVLATITGIAGGMIRDVVFAQSMPRALADPSYVIITVASGIVIFLLYTRTKSLMNTFMKFDAVGLGVFTIIGATFAYELFGLEPLPIILAGMLTAVGGGILRDVLVNQVPVIFVQDMYASASLAGAVIFYGILLAGLDLHVATVVGIALTTTLRLLAMKYKWQLPKAKGI